MSNEDKTQRISGMWHFFLRPSRRALLIALAVCPLAVVGIGVHARGGAPDARHGEVCVTDLAAPGRAAGAAPCSAPGR